ncbi:FKBP-type peptidyl-prolyl cis-trans isomerase,putative [Trypanosoma brucei gambiense DAL972]|uniref:peptidylprolyl isomerase n=1 Tax=Trypanosoma brucei gambiense (strain MHOM/CI/86/DAL972) TaxID=679716 RepID=D0A0P0_TRYB9|nr:FKBP-type peptidyl-prolyl cis-trans isomerase,putative [Trypanosoma brucei gambiense DAL972]CBH16798.1 FKBP-type peptidyl-prolyl cis-trans isomerase,putative [Trypanosoma brucei gambiense DAL972]|eukprot:XP_011779062.1 FKBP-type peptidyl-prolyl cis-trans isomerase,putative [Trypanosoma brucei gambiense DAL972]
MYGVECFRPLGLAAFMLAVLSVVRVATSEDDPNKLTPQERIDRYRKRVARSFLLKMAEEPGAMTLPSGVVVHVLNRGGGGRSAAVDDECTVHYTGTLKDGTVFDSSRDRGHPFKLKLGQVIVGWQEVLQLMRPGDRWKVFIPPEHGYGARGAGPKIPPHSALVFDMELISIEGGGNGRTEKEVEEVLKGYAGKGDL